MSLTMCFPLSGDGLIQEKELQHVMRACMDENGMKFDEGEVDDLTRALFHDATMIITASRKASSCCGAAAAAAAAAAAEQSDSAGHSSHHKLSMTGHTLAAASSKLTAHGHKLSAHQVHMLYAKYI
jgi:protein-tyrosine-phosphatase